MSKLYEQQAEVTRLTEMSTKLAEMLNDKIDECTILEKEVASLRARGLVFAELSRKYGMHNTPTMVRVCTDFGPDIVFANVMVTTGKTFVKTEVVSWSMDGREQPLDALSEDGHRTLRRLAREKVDES